MLEFLFMFWIQIVNADGTREVKLFTSDPAPSMQQCKDDLTEFLDVHGHKMDSQVLAYTDCTRRRTYERRAR